MKNSFFKPLFLVLFCFNTGQRLVARSPFRRLSHETPSVTVTSYIYDTCSGRRSYDADRGTLHSAYIRPWVYTSAFDEQFYSTKQFPKENVDLNDGCTVVGSVVRHEIACAIDELMRHKKGKSLRYSFILKDSDFNYTNCSGLIVARLRRYPLVIKVYRETPSTFCHPYTKGLVPLLFFRAGNGLTRHLSGLTRIPAREIVAHYVAQDSFWKDKVTLPRKWLWLPERKQLWLTIEGNHELLHFRVSIPGLYAIVCDAIDIERPCSLFDSEDRNITVMLSNICENKLDFHISNFIHEKKTGKIAIIDTEYFTIMLGIRKPFYPESYGEALIQSTIHSAKKILGTSKVSLKSQCLKWPQLFNVYAIASQLMNQTSQQVSSQY